MMNPELDRSVVVDFLTRLANVWSNYRDLGYLIAQRCVRDLEYKRNLLVDPGISVGDLLRDFTGVKAVVKIVRDDVEFVDKSGQTFFAIIVSTDAGLKLKSLKIECPVCFGEPQEPPCSICLGAGKV